MEVVKIRAYRNAVGLKRERELAGPLVRVKQERKPGEEREHRAAKVQSPQAPD